MPDEYKRNNDTAKGRKFQLIGLDQSNAPKGVRFLTDSLGSGDKIASGCDPVILTGYCKMSCGGCFIDREPTVMLFMPGTIKMLSATSVTGCCPE